VSRVVGASLLGVEGFPVEVEVLISSLLPRVDVVGLAEAEVREASARVRAAITASGIAFPDRRVTVNLAPAAQRKSGAALDLPIAIGVLAATGAIESEELGRTALLGELALDGRLRPVRGALALTLGALRGGARDVIVPEANAAEAALATDARVLAAASLAEIVAHLRGESALVRVEPSWDSEASLANAPRLCDVRGQERAKRALIVAAAGGHGLLLKGAPGCGKTMLARRLIGLLPPLAFDEAVEVTRIHGTLSRLADGAVVARERPFRSPHHSASAAGLLGGGNPPRPGEISLAHRGVLFLDELAEFERRCLEALRQVLEERRITVARAGTSCVFPAHFQLVAATNPCPCGWRGSAVRDCRCDDGAVARYLAKLSGPLLDRIDLQLALRPLPWRELLAPAREDEDSLARERVAAARTRQERRYAGTAFQSNAELPDASLEQQLAATPEAWQLLGKSVDALGLSARAARRVLKVARTIADLDAREKTTANDVAEALTYRAESLSA
jgi:magnesium chelatase family protein